MVNEKFISVMAILIAIGTLVWQIYHDVQGNKEELVIRSFQADPEYKLKISKSNNKVSLPLQFKILLANTGDISIPIINFKEQPADSKSDATRTNTLSDVGFTSEDDKPVTLPIIVKSGEGIILKHIIRLSLEAQSLDRINQAFFEETGTDIYDEDISYYDLLYYSIKAGQDVFGNSFIGSGARDEAGFPETEFQLEAKNLKQPKFDLIFTSARNNDYTYTLTIYPGTD